MATSKTTPINDWRERMRQSIAASKATSKKLPQPRILGNEAKVLEDGTILYADGHALRSRIVIPLMLTASDDGIHAEFAFYPCDERAAALQAGKHGAHWLICNKYAAERLTTYARSCWNENNPLYIRAMNLTTTGRVSKGVRYVNPILTRTGWADFDSDEDLMNSLAVYEAVQANVSDGGAVDAPYRRKF